MKGKFITFEGSEGSGKTTQIQMVSKYLSSMGFSVLFVREPGGTDISERIRDILLDLKNTGMCDECEMLLYMAARAQLVTEVIIPALENGRIVLCDRFLDSTLAYQGYGNGIDINIIKKIGEFAVKGITPDLTFVFDIDVKMGFSRIHRPKDRIELRSISYHERVREGYLRIAAEAPERIKLVRVEGSEEDVFACVRGHVDRLLGV